MKSTAIIFAIIILVLASCGEHPEAVRISAGNYLPHTAGSYWVYENVILDNDGNPTGEKYIDSVVYTGTVQKGDRTALELTTFWGKHYFYKSYFFTTGNLLYYNDCYIHTFFPRDTLCPDFGYCADSTSGWKMLLDFEKSKWFSQDSIVGDLYPVIIPKIINNDTTWISVFSQTRWYLTFNAEKINSETVTIMDKPINPVAISIKGNEINRIVHPDTSIHFRDDPNGNCECFENKRAIVGGKYDMTLKYAENIGLVQFIGKIEHCRKTGMYYKRTLLRYKIN